jgi:D-glycero-alpha-D-manno-heptose 1-phosphate guanylyltransferase
VSLNKAQETDVLILCGGLGTRFRAVREDIPKALAPIQGVPFIDLLLDDLVLQGFRRIILATGHLSSQLEYHAKQQNDAEYIISCEPIQLGTGGAIKFAEKHFRSKQILILNGDSHINCDFNSLLEFHHNNNADMSILLSSATKGDDYGNVKINDENRITVFSEKPEKSESYSELSLINAGVYCLNCSMLTDLEPKVECSIEKEWIPSWLQSHRIIGLRTEQSVHDIGTPERYKDSQTMFQDKISQDTINKTK